VDGLPELWGSCASASLSKASSVARQGSAAFQLDVALLQQNLAEIQHTKKQQLQDAGVEGANGALFAMISYAHVIEEI